MNALTGTMRNGQIVLDEPAELAEGTRVEVLPVETAQPTLGMREEDWPTTSEGIATLLARMDQREPLQMTAEEEADWKAALKARKDSEKANFSKEGERLRRMWE